VLLFHVYGAKHDQAAGFVSTDAVTGYRGDDFGLARKSQFFGGNLAAEVSSA
jgi:hypothetical protein